MKPGLKNPLLRTLNLLLYLSLCAMAGTGVLLQWRLPPGSKGGKGMSALGLDRHEWGEIHLWIGLAFLIACLLHLAIHWRWLVQIAAKTRKSLLAIGLLTGTAIVAFFVFIPVEKETQVPQRQYSNRSVPYPADRSNLSSDLQKGDSEASKQIRRQLRGQPLPQSDEPLASQDGH